MSLVVTVPGEAVPQGSTRAFIPRGWTRPIITADNTRTKPWRATVASAAIEAQLSQGTWPVVSDRPIRLDVQCYFARPASVSERRRPMHTVKPDLDKLLRAIKDSLTKILWRDDAQVVSVCVSKAYAPATDPAHTVIRAIEIVPLVAPAPRSLRPRAGLPLLDEGGTRV